MKKYMKKAFALLLAFVMTMAITSPMSISAASSELVMDEYLSADINLELADAGYLLIQAELTSVITGEPFIAFFNAETGRVSSYDLVGTSLGIRYVANEDEFWELVESNRQALNNVDLQNIMRNAQQVEMFVELNDVVLVDISTPMTTSFDPESGRVSLYDENGILIEYRYGYDEVAFAELINAQKENARLQSANLSPIQESIEPLYQGIAPFNFDTGFVTMTVPRANQPLPPAAVRVGGGGNFLPTTHLTRSVSLQTVRFPANMPAMDYLIINDWGDDFSYGFDITVNTTVTHTLGFPGYGDRFVAYVSSYWGTFTGVQLRFFADDAPRQTATITFNTNGGSTGNTTSIRTVGQPIGFLPTVFRANHTFRGWYTTSSGDAGQRITSDTIVTGNATFFARWYSHRTRTLTHTGQAWATGMAGQHVTSTPVSFNAGTIPVGAVIESISLNVGSSTSSGLIMPNMIFIAHGVYGRLDLPWNGANNSVINTNAFNRLSPRTTWTVHWAGPVLGNTPGNLWNPEGTAAVRGFSNMRLTINYVVRL